MDILTLSLVGSLPVVPHRLGTAASEGKLWQDEREADDQLLYFSPEEVGGSGWTTWLAWAPRVSFPRALSTAGAGQIQIVKRPSLPRKSTKISPHGPE